MGANERKSILLFRLDRFACSLGNAEVNEPLLNERVYIVHSKQLILSIVEGRFPPNMGGRRRKRGLTTRPFVGEIACKVGAFHHDAQA